MVEPSSSDFRIITAIFRVSKILRFYGILCNYFVSLVRDMVKTVHKSVQACLVYLVNLVQDMVKTVRKSILAHLVYFLTLVREMVKTIHKTVLVYLVYFVDLVEHNS